jgi:soluble lytic murein transglycosylase-like protein/TolA-binding protein
VLQWLRSRWWLVAVVVVLVIAGIVLVTYRDRILPGSVPHEEPELPAKAEAPPDLQKLRDAYAAGTAALGRGDGADAVKHLSSFTFGTRAVEEYRLYHLAKAYQLAGNGAAARVTLAKLWRRQPKLVHAPEAAATLGKLYVDAGNYEQAAEVFASVADRWNTVNARLHSGDVAGAYFAARSIVIDAPASKEADDAIALVRSIAGIDENAPLPLTPSERLERATALIAASAGQKALDELATLEPSAPASLKPGIQLQRGLALHQLKRFEESNKVLEPLTSGPYKYAIPALRTAARNYAIVAASINPTVYKTVKEKKKTGTKKVRVGKGKKRRWVRQAVYKTVPKQIKLIDLAKKNKKDEYDRLASERLKDLLQISELGVDTRYEVLNALIGRAASKNQDAYVQELVPQVIRIDPLADPALQHFWDKGWAAYARGDLGTARKLFRFIADTYTHPNVKRQSEYWYARCAERQGQKEEARAIYQKLAGAPYADVYALHSVQRGAKRTENKTNPLKKEGADWREIAEKQMPPELVLAYELTALSAVRDAYGEVRKNMRRQNTRFAEALLADIYNTTGEKVLMYRALRRAWPQLATPEQDSTPAYFLAMYYPRKYAEEIDEYAGKQKLDPSLVRAIILQESYYNPKARSSVGATGLMQLMPPTAKEHAKKMGIAFAVSRLENPEVNVRLGTFHLRMLLDMFRGNSYLAVASYNAGQGNVLKWRRAAPGKPMDEFIESIPFQETRNYVKRVTMLKSAYERLSS